MAALEAMGPFVLDQLLKMQWLSLLVARLLGTVGVDTTSKLGGTLQFFVYDTVKIVILLCVLIFVVSWVQSYFPPERSRKIMGRFSGMGGNVVGALLGTVTPFCSCSSIPIFMGFTRAGLPLGVTFSFLISSPMVDLGSLVLIMSVFGPGVAVAYTAVGLAIAVVGGGIIQHLHMEDQLADFVRGEAPADIQSVALTKADRARYAASETWSTFKKVGPYILLGVGMGALIHNWIPRQLVEAVLGGANPLAVPLATLVGAPIYADTFGAIPIAEALFLKGVGLGTVLAFMMSVTTLSIPSLTMLSRAIRPRLMAAFVGVCLVGMVISGYVFNSIQPLLG
jgi:uncharacterized membrane protein YraQ (UPF0718 family)